MLGSALVYAGALAGLAGLASILWPLRWIGIGSRRRGAQIAAAGIALAVAGFLLPHPRHAAAGRDTLIDQTIAEWQFGERHERRIHGTPRQVFAAIRRVTASDIFLFRALTFIRNPWRRVEGEHILNAPSHKPILDVALGSGFIVVGEEPDRELVIGTVVITPPEVVRAALAGQIPPLDAARFRTLGRPGFARAVMNFRATPERDGWTRVTTETRVQTVDEDTARRFGRYWRVIYPGSWIIRWSWLRAIEARIAS